MTWLNTFLASCAVVALSACGDSGSGGSGVGGDSGGGDTSIGGMGGMGGDAAAAPSAPVLDMLEPVHGALHVYWTNVTADCETVHGERKTATVAYEEVFSEPGNVDNKADQGATDTAETYTYRLRCMKGGVMSDYSNELSGMPE